MKRSHEEEADDASKKAKVDPSTAYSPEDAMAGPPEVPAPAAPAAAAPATTVPPTVYPSATLPPPPPMPADPYGYYGYPPAPMPPIMPTMSPTDQAQFAQLGPQTQAAFHALFASMKVAPTELDASIYKSLADFHDATAQEIVGKFTMADLHTVRNKTGFFIGILKSFRKKGVGMRSGPPAPASASTYSQQTTSSYYGYPPMSSAYDPYASATTATTDASGTAAAHTAAAAADPYAAYYGYPYTYPQDPSAAAAAAADPNAYQYQQYYGQTYDYSGQQQGGGGRKASKGAGLAGLTQPIQDMFNQMFQAGQVRPEDVPDSIYDSLHDFCGIKRLFSLSLAFFFMYALV